MSTTVTYKGSTLTTVENETRTLTTQGKYLEDNITLVDITSGGSGSGAVWQDAQGYVHLSDEGDMPLQTKTVTPTTSAQTITADAGYYALQEVDVSAVATGTAGTPTATKGAVSNHSVSVTPSVTNTTGYITGSTKTGTAVTVSASELVSGTKSISANGTGIDVTDYASVDVNVSSSSTTHTATIVRSGINNAMTPLYCYVRYNSRTYYTRGDTFTFNAGDTLSTTIRTYNSGDRVVMENGIELYREATTTGRYNYTLPDYDVDITLEQIWETELGVINIGKKNEAYNLVATTEYSVNTSSTTAIAVGTFQTGVSSIWTSGKMVYIKIRDKAGARSSRYYGCDCFLYNPIPHYSLSDTQTFMLGGNMYTVNDDGQIMSPICLSRTTANAETAGYGVYPTLIKSNGDIDIKARYSSNTGTINATYVIDVYLVDWAYGVAPFNG